MSDDDGSIDISAAVAEICERLGVCKNYVTRIDLEPGRATVSAFKGRDGRFKGKPYIVDVEGGREAAMERPLKFKVRT